MNNIILHTLEPSMKHDYICEGVFIIVISGMNLFSNNSISITIYLNGLTNQYDIAVLLIIIFVVY